jgi:hypothetical protein
MAQGICANDARPLECGERERGWLQPQAFTQVGERLENTGPNADRG